MIGAAAGAMLAPATGVNGEEAAANIVSGIVYEHRSRAGTRQLGDPGLGGILVSNGRDVVRTDADGRYQLPIGYEGLVFVIKPAGFSVPLALIRAEEPQAFDVILFTDPQPESGAELDFVRDTALADVVGTRAAFGGEHNRAAAHITRTPWYAAACRKQRNCCKRLSLS
jgi:hypothetical protein